MTPARARLAGAAVCVALLAAAALIYAPTRGHGFVNWDDPGFYSRNPHLAQGLSPAGVAWAFESTRAANWFPLTRLSVLLDAELHGASPGGVHVTSALLHAGSALLLFGAWWRMTGALAASAVVAAVFAVHPLQVETVAWAAERKGVLSGFFWMLALFAYAGVGGGRLGPGRAAAVAAALALGLMSKFVLATLPAVLLLLDWWPLGRLDARGAPGRIDPARLRRAVLEKLPLVLLVVAAGVLVFAAQRSGGAVASLDRVPAEWRLANAALAYVAYVAGFVWPRGLAAFHPYPQAGIETASLIGALVLLAGVSVLAIHQRRCRPWIAVGWLWFLGTLVPMIGLVQLGSAARADRYMYIPGIGLAVAVVWTVADALGRRAAPRVAAGVVALTALLALGLAASRQVSVWRSSETLFDHALAVTDGNYLAHTMRARALLVAGRDAEALDAYRASLAIHPAQVALANNLAWLLATHPDPALRAPDEALVLSRDALRRTGGLDPSILDTLAAALAASGRFDAAERRALQAHVLARAHAPGLAPAIEARARLYREGRAYTEAPVVPPMPYEDARLSPVPAPPAGRARRAPWRPGRAPGRGAAPGAGRPRPRRSSPPRGRRPGRRAPSRAPGASGAGPGAAPRRSPPAGDG